MHVLLLKNITTLVHYFVNLCSCGTGKWNQMAWTHIIITEKTEAGLRGLGIRDIDVKSQILVHKML